MELILTRCLGLEYSDTKVVSNGVAIWIIFYNLRIECILFHVLYNYLMLALLIVEKNKKVEIFLVHHTKSSSNS